MPTTPSGPLAPGAARGSPPVARVDGRPLVKRDWHVDRPPRRLSGGSAETTRGGPDAVPRADRGGGRGRAATGRASPAGLVWRRRGLAVRAVERDFGCGVTGRGLAAVTAEDDSAAAVAEVLAAAAKGRRS